MSSTTSDAGESNPMQVRRRLVFVLACLLIICASFAYSPWVMDGPILCPLRFTTGIPCPACGLTRSFCAVSQGELHRALEFHLFGPLLFAVCVCAGPFVLIELVRRRRFAWAHRFLFSYRIAACFAIILIAYHSVRLGQMISEGQFGPALRDSAGAATYRFIFGG